MIDNEDGSTDTVTSVTLPTAPAVVVGLTVRRWWSDGRADDGRAGVRFMGRDARVRLVVGAR